jgi:outer membrane lipoprotein-sorting protein
MLSAFLSTVAVIAAETALGLGAPALIAGPPPASVSAPVKTPAPAIVAEATAATNDTAAKPAATAPAQIAAATPAAQASVFADRSDQAVADEVLRHLEGLTTLAGDFVQTAPSGAVVTGKFYLRRPGQIRFDYDDPSPITIVATGGLVYVENADLETTDSYPLKKTPLRFLLSKKIEIGDAKLTAVERGRDTVAVTYASIDEDTEGDITLVLSAPTLSIEQWAVRDGQGGVTVVALQGVSSGGKLDNRLFRAPEAGGAFINK